MANTFLLPDSDPKGVEHEKWEAIVDSVIEFISASKAMLQAINDRIKQGERFRDENKKKMVEEKVDELRYYEEFLNKKLNADKESKLSVSNENQESGDSNPDTDKDKIFETADRLNDRPRKKFVSKIPRTQSFVEQRTRPVAVDSDQIKGKYNRSRKNTEVGYSIIHQRSKTPKQSKLARF